MIKILETHPVHMTALETKGVWFFNMPMWVWINLIRISDKRSLRLRYVTIDNRSSGDLSALPCGDVQSSESTCHMSHASTVNKRTREIVPNIAVHYSRHQKPVTRIFNYS